MKNYFTFFVVVLLVTFTGILSPTYGQWDKNIIDSNLYTATIVYVADIDGDTDLDVAATGFYVDKVVWYEYDYPTWSKHTIDGNLGGACGVYVADIDGDDTLDVVAAGNRANDVVWYENNHATWTKHTIDANLYSARCLYIADINLDDIPDVVATGMGADDVVWYKNENGGQTWPKETIDANLDGANYVFTADIDGDDTLDVVATGWYANDVVWYHNPGITGIEILSDRMPTSYVLSQNYPNPFNPSTRIEFSIPKLENVKIEVYNILGQRIKTLLDKPMTTGQHQIEFIGSNLTSGIYYYRIEAGEFQDVKKMILLR